MSQKKVDYYKEQKANRKNIIKKEKRMRRIEQIVVGAVGILAACWICFSVYTKVTEKDTTATESVSTDLNVTALDDFMNQVESAEEAGTETAEEAEAESTEEAGTESTGEAEADSAEETEAE